MSSRISNALEYKITEILHVDSKKVVCEGSKGASGHPKVYLNMGSKDYVICPYCSKVFTVSEKVDANFLKDNL